MSTTTYHLSNTNCNTFAVHVIAGIPSTAQEYTSFVTSISLTLCAASSPNNQVNGPGSLALQSHSTSHKSPQLSERYVSATVFHRLAHLLVFNSHLNADVSRCCDIYIRLPLPSADLVGKTSQPTERWLHRPGPLESRIVLPVTGIVDVIPRNLSVRSHRCKRSAAR